MFRISKLVFVFVFALNQVNSDVQQKIFLTVYYESKCPDSKYFIVDQLKPAIRLLHKYLILKLVPFGKADSRNGGRDGFKCQHGPSECAGNMVQSCALDLMQKRNDMEKVSYVTCEMETKAGTRGDMQCVKKASLNDLRVDKCVNSNKGLSLQLAAEYDTKRVRPKFIPTVTIDGVFNKKVQDNALKDLIGVLCSRLEDTPTCANYFG